MSSKNYRALLEKLTDASFELSRVISASDSTEGFAKSYLEDKKSFRKMISAGIKTEKLLKEHFARFALHVISNVNWEYYQDRIIIGAEPKEALVLYRGGKGIGTNNLYDPKSESYGISTSMNPASARAYAKASGVENVAEITLQPDAKIKLIDSKGKGIDMVYSYEDLQKLSAKGYDAVKDTADTIEREVRILNPNIIAKTRMVDLTTPPAPASTDLWGATIDFEGEKLNLQITFSNGMYDAFGAGMAAAHKQVGIAVRILPTDAPAIKALRAYGLDRAKLITDATKIKIKESLISSMKQGLTKEEAAARLNKIITDPARARMIAHTEQVQAFTIGRKTVGEAVGARWKIWENGQSGACKACIALHGKKIRWDDEFVSGKYSAWAAPLHPSCYCGWSMVL